MRPSLTRRQVLGTLGAAVGGSAVVGGAAAQIPRDPIVTWEPAPGTWPCGRYDLGHTAANPHASPPAAPEIVWQTTTPGMDWKSGFVVDPERVYASGEQLTALSRRDGTIQWQQAKSPGPHIIYDGTLYHGASPLMAVDAATGQPHWRATRAYSAEDFTRFTVTAETVLVGDEAYDIHDGSYKWSVDQVQFAAQNGALYGYTKTEPPRVTKYRSRSVLNVALGTGPTKAWEKVWEGEHDSAWDYSVVQNNLLIQMQNPGGLVVTGVPGLAAFDTESGERVWTGLSPSDVASAADFSIGEPDHYAVQIQHSAFAKNRGFMWVRMEKVFGSTVFSGVVAVSLADGAILWQRSLDPSPYFLDDIAVANGTVILALESVQRDEGPDPGTVQALDAATGRDQWRVSTTYDPVQLAAVDGTIFAVLDTHTEEKPNRVIALR